MGKILLIVFAVTLVVVFGYIFFGGKKKSKKNKSKAKEPAPEKKVEKAIKTSKDEQPKEEKKEEKKEEPVVKMPEKEEQKGFRIIKKKSEVKINKKALKSGSRNPSITKVFDKNGKIEEETDKIEFIDIEEEKTKDAVLEQSQDVGRFGARETNYDVVNNGVNFQIRNPEGTHNRAPILTDRTMFGSHLNETDENNPYSISGIGIKETLKNIEKQTRNVDDDTEEMVRNVKRNFLGIEEDIDPFDVFNRRVNKEEVEQKKTISIKDIDAKTLILADAISNPKYKKHKK